MKKEIKTFFDKLLNQEINKNLNSYFDYMTNIYGDDTTIATFFSKDNIVDSLSLFSNVFCDYSEIELYGALIHKAILSNSKNPFVNLVSSLAEEKKFDDIITLMLTKKEVLNGLVVNYARSYSCSDYELLMSKDTPWKSTEALTNLYYYVSSSAKSNKIPADELCDSEELDKTEKEEKDDKSLIKVLSLSEKKPKNVIFDSVPDFIVIADVNKKVAD